MGLFKTQVHSFLSSKNPPHRIPKDEIGLEGSYFP